MIAVPFIEAIQFIKDKEIDCSEQYWNIIILKELYSESFKPEMIVEYFEGWVEGVVSHRKYILSEEVEISFPSHNAKYKIWNVDVEGILFLPQTLDQFITDCQRAGIELVWKESVVKQYFK